MIRNEIFFQYIQVFSSNSSISGHPEMISRFRFRFCRFGFSYLKLVAGADPEFFKGGDYFAVPLKWSAISDSECFYGVQGRSQTIFYLLKQLQSKTSTPSYGSPLRNINRLEENRKRLKHHSVTIWPEMTIVPETMAEV